MAIIAGMICMNCEKTPARDDSHFCTDKCGKAFVKRMRGPVDCDCGNSEDDIRDARRKGWRDVTEDAEGISNNYVGICPECVR